MVRAACVLHCSLRRGVEVGSEQAAEGVLGGARVLKHACLREKKIAAP